MINANLESITKAAHAILREETKYLPLVPSVAVKLLQLTNDENVNFADLAHIIETEPALAAKVLQSVNSAAYGFSTKIASVNRAVNILGFSTVRQLAIDLLFYDKLIKHSGSKKFDTLFFWQHCLFVALLSKKIATILKHPNPDLVYTAGLLHDIGKVVLESYGRISYSDFITTLNNSENTLVESERRFFGLTHADIGYVFCKEWELPEAISAVVACHHTSIDEMPMFSEYKTEIAIVAFANYVAWMQGLGSIQNDGHSLLADNVLSTLKFEQLDIEALMQFVDQEMQKTRVFYGIKFPNVNKLRATLVKTSLNLSLKSKNTGRHKSKSSSSLTIPHQSLNPEEFVPDTLAAIQAEFAFDRCLLLDIDAKKRCLSLLYSYPHTLQTQLPSNFEIDASQISGLFLHCLRDKKAEIISTFMEPQNPIAEQLGASEFLVVPVLSHKRLIGMLYADNIISQTSLDPSILTEMQPIANELGIALFHAKQYELQKKSAQLDPLTHMFNKRMIDDFLSNIFKPGAASVSQLAVGFIDIDHFKLFNDVCGHQAGDDVLKIVADILRSLTRPGDFIGRYGGEEFLFVLKNIDQKGAYVYAERLRKEIERRGRLMSERFKGHELTASIGVAIFTKEYANYMELIESADQAMYRAKNSGRNKVILLASKQQQTLFKKH